MRIFFFWQRTISKPLAHEFHFGQYVAGEKKVRFDTWEGGEAVHFSKNVHTFARIVGSQYAGITGTMLEQLLPLSKIKVRKIEFVKFFRTPWSLQGENLFESYVNYVEQHVRNNRKEEWTIRKQYPMDSDYAYDYYVEKDACDFTPRDDYWEIVAKPAMYVPIASIPNRDYQVPDDAIIVKRAPFYSMDSSTKVADLEACSFSWSVCSRAQDSVLLISPSLLEEYGILRVKSGAYVCTQPVFEVFEQELDSQFWDFRILTSSMIASPKAR